MITFHPSSETCWMSRVGRSHNVEQGGEAGLFGRPTLELVSRLGEALQRCLLALTGWNVGENSGDGRMKGSAARSAIVPCTLMRVQAAKGPSVVSAFLSFLSHPTPPSIKLSRNYHHLLLADVSCTEIPLQLASI